MGLECSSQMMREYLNNQDYLPSAHSFCRC